MSKTYLGSTLIEKSYLGSDFVSDVEIGVFYDEDAKNFFNATGIINTNLRAAVNSFVTELKNASLWDNMIQILPFVADNTASLATQFSYNLKNTGSYQATFPNGVPTSDLSGFQSVETSSRVYCDTNLNPETEFDATDSVHVSIYTTSPSPTGDAADWGTFGGGGFFQDYAFVFVGRNLSGSNSQKVVGFGGAVTSPGGLISGTSVDISGSFVATLNDTSASLRANGESVISGSIRQDSKYGLGNAFLGALNNTNSPAGPGLVTNRKYQCLTVGSFLTNTEADTLSSIIQEFEENIDIALGTNRAI